MFFPVRYTTNKKGKFENLKKPQPECRGDKEVENSK